MRLSQRHSEPAFLRLLTVIKIQSFFITIEKKKAILNIQAKVNTAVRKQQVTKNFEVPRYLRDPNKRPRAPVASRPNLLRRWRRDDQAEIPPLLGIRWQQLYATEKKLENSKFSSNYYSDFKKSDSKIFYRLIKITENFDRKFPKFCSNFFQFNQFSKIYSKSFRTLFE